VILTLTGVMWPQYYDKVFTYAQPASFGEVAFMLWLVIKGARSQPLPSAVSSSAGVRLHFAGCRQSGSNVTAARSLGLFSSLWPAYRTLLSEF
jgi:hypothetical protein